MRTSLSGSRISSGFPWICGYPYMYVCKLTESLFGFRPFRAKPVEVYGSLAVLICSLQSVMAVNGENSNMGPTSVNAHKGEELYHGPPGLVKLSVPCCPVFMPWAGILVRQLSLPCDL